MNQLFPHRKGESMAVSNDLISITHKIELVPNQEAKAHFRKAFGCARLAYNWGLAKWQDYYKQGIKKSPRILAILRWSLFNLRLAF